MSKINKVKCQMLKINKVNFDGAYLRSSSGHFFCIIQSAHLFVGVEAAVQGDFSQIQEHGAGAKGDKAGRQRGASYIY